MTARFLPTQNRHHLIIEQRSRTDSERIEDIAADAMGALRRGLDMLDGRDAESTLRQRCLRDELRRLLDAGEVLTEATRRHLADLIASLDAPGADREALACALRDAERVADLLVARAHLARSRGR